MPTYEYEGPVEITELPITVKALATRTGYLNSAVATANYTQAKVATPAFTPVAGSYPYPVTVTITCATSGAQIKYSVDGSEPSLNYTVPLSVSSNTPVKAKAVKTDWLDSDVASVTYEQAQVPVVTFTPGSSAVVFPQIVYLATVLSGTTIYYTVGTNPPDPTTSDILYDPDDGVELVAACIIKAFAIKSGYIDSDVNSATYTQVVVATPTISQSYSPGGGFWYPNTVSLACATSGATIRYTTDGSTPTGSSTLYTAPFAITSSVTVKAKAFKSGYADSDVASRLYDQQRVTATPTISQNNAESGVPNPTSPLYPTVVTITGEAGSTFYYTTDGSTPDNTDTLYSAPFNNTGQTPIKAIAYKTDYLPSSVATQAYTQRVVVTPTFSHPGGEIILGSTVSISTTTPGCTIYYTVDGSTPDNTDTVYSGPVTIGSALTLKAIAYKTGGFQPGSWAVSAVATASYTGPLSPAPTISPNGSGEYELPLKVLITTAAAVDSIWYTTDGSTPTNGGGTSTQYTGAFTVSTHATVVKAVTFKTGYTESGVVSVTINQATWTYEPLLSPAANSAIPDGQTVTSTLRWKRTAAGAMTSSLLGSVASTDTLTNIKALRNGKYMVSGYWTNTYGNASEGYAIKGLVRLNQDMTPDVNWRDTSGSDFGTGTVNDFAELSDGSIIAVGTFTGVNGVTRNRICKFNPDGTLSNTFTTSFNGTTVWRVAVNKDDLIFVAGGDFTQVTPTGGAAISVPYMVILRADGTLAANVGSGVSAPTGVIGAYIDSICALSTGEFLIAGLLYHPAQGFGVLKLPVNGVWPATGYYYSPMQHYNNWGGRRIHTVRPLRDGRAVIAGNFNTADFFYTPASSKQRIAVLLTNGTVDESFTAPNLSINTTGTLNEGSGYILEVEQTRAGSLCIVGYFRSVGMTSNSAAAPYNRHHGISYINLDGTLVQTAVTGGLGYGLFVLTMAPVRRLALTLNDEPIVFVAHPSTGGPFPATYYGEGGSPASFSFTGVGKFKFNGAASPAALCLTHGLEGTTVGVTKFTVSGSDPTLASTDLPGSGISLNQTAGVFPTLKVRGAKPFYAGSVTTTSGFKVGTVVSSTYTWIQVATPVITPNGGAVIFGSTAAITCATSGASIYYTTDGSTPDNTDTLYSGPITISAAVTIKAIAYKANYNTSSVATASFTQLTLDPPSALPDGGELLGGDKITLYHTQLGILTPAMTANTAPSGIVSASHANSTAFQAFDRNNSTAWYGSASPPVEIIYEFPTAKKVYQFDIRLLNAITVFNLQILGSTNGSSWTTLYVNQPTGAWTGGQEKTFWPTTVGAYTYYRFIAQVGSTYAPQIAEIKMYGGVDIYYTVDGSTPDSGDTAYTGPITFATDMTLKAIAIQTGAIDSSIMSKDFTQAQVATPVANPDGGAIQFGSTVALTCATSGATIKYTTNGDEPDAGSNGYENDRIPSMTGASTPAGTAAASSENSINYAWKAMDDGPTGTLWVANGALPQWLSYDFGSAKKIKGFRIKVWSDSNHYPTAFKLQYSTNNTDWNDVDGTSQSGVTWSSQQERSYGVLTVYEARYWRLYITANGGSTNFTTIQEFQLIDGGTTYIYSSPLTVSANTTIKAMARKANYIDSDTMTESYTQATLADVVFDPVSGTSGASLITLSNAVSGTTIRYTIDGSTPTVSNGFTYSGPFVIVTPKTVKAYAYKTGYIDSAVATATYP